MQPYERPFYLRCTKRSKVWDVLWWSQNDIKKFSAYLDPIICLCKVLKWLDDADTKKTLLNFWKRWTLLKPNWWCHLYCSLWTILIVFAMGRELMCEHFKWSQMSWMIITKVYEHFKLVGRGSGVFVTALDSFMVLAMEHWSSVWLTIRSLSAGPMVVWELANRLMVVPSLPSATSVLFIAVWANTKAFGNIFSKLPTFWQFLKRCQNLSFFWWEYFGQLFHRHWATFYSKLPVTLSDPANETH